MRIPSVKRYRKQIFRHLWPWSVVVSLFVGNLGFGNQKGVPANVSYQRHSEPITLHIRPEHLGFEIISVNNRRRMSQPTAQLTEDHSGSKKRKRPRAIQACERCRLKKYKCDESYPCLHCKSRCYPMILWNGFANGNLVEAALECVYVGGYRPRESSPLAWYITRAYAYSNLETCN